MGEKYDAAAHLFNWARNDARLNAKLVNFVQHAQNAKASSAALAALSGAREVFGEATISGDVSKSDVSAVDLLRVAIMFLEWEGEE